MPTPPYIGDFYDLSDKMPYAEIERALTDNDGNDAIGVWGLIQTGVADEINGLLAPRYNRNTPDTLHPRLVTAAKWLTLETLFMRRGLYGEANPATSKADAERKALREIGSGKVILDAVSPLPLAPTGAAAAATTENLKTRPSSGLMC